ncbi:hypothetical protein C8R47DRAFT_1261516 [Mycena vitilis]|nr:hypothetical protein C8R47DRAFT_1261516 [Mycena vitilis]
MRLNEHNNCCTMCGSYLAVEHATGGQVPGSDFLRCRNHQPQYFYRFPPPASAQQPLTSTYPSSLSSSAISPPLSTSATSATSSGSRITCANRQCKVERLDPGCVRRMCRKHCIAEGPCALRAHENERVRKAGITPTSTQPIRRPSVPPNFALAMDDILAESRAPLQALEEYQAREDARIAQQGRELDALLGIRSPSPDVPLELALFQQEQEEHDLQLALRLSQEDTQRSAPSPPPVAGSSRLRALSLSPDFPDPSRLLAASVSPIPAPTLTAPSVPRRRAKAFSANQAAAPAPLRITTQMNETWMNAKGGPQVHGRSQQAQVSSPSSQASSTFHIRKAAGRQPFVDPKTQQRLIVVFWNESETVHQVFFIDQVPSWPTWCTSEAIGPLAQLLDASPPLDLWSQHFKTWICIEDGFMHEVTRDCVVMLRRRDIECLNEHVVVNQFYPSALAPTHLRHNLPRERAAVRHELKARRGSSSTVIVDDTSSDADSDVEVVPTPVKKRVAKQDSGSRPKRPKLSITTDYPAASGSAPPTTTSLASSASFSFSSRTPSPTSTPASSPAPTAAWPGGMYVVDMVHGFMKMRSTDTGGKVCGTRHKGNHAASDTHLCDTCVGVSRHSNGTCGRFARLSDCT